jgi:hypothetical protein
MLSPKGTNGTIGVLVTAISARSRSIHQHYSAWLYRQALLSLGGSVLAEQAIRDVTADESAPCPPPSADRSEHGRQRRGSPNR